MCALEAHVVVLRVLAKFGCCRVAHVHCACMRTIVAHMCEFFSVWDSPLDCGVVRSVFGDFCGGGRWNVVWFDRGRYCMASCARLACRHGGAIVIQAVAKFCRGRGPRRSATQFNAPKDVALWSRVRSHDEQPFVGRSFAMAPVPVACISASFIACPRYAALVVL